jgi:serine/threonine protein kinase/beta-lactam-binding protein with PASTA domain
LVPIQTADPLIGRALEGRYRIQSMLARGGMSTVYVALDERLERLVAVKVMSSGLSADPAFVDRFIREARAAARLSHVNVVSVYDQGNDSGHVFLVMELVRGRTLRDLLRETRPLPPALAVSIMSPMLAALAAAHRAGLVHRDVKPENILLADDGVVKVADFGLARAIESDHTTTQTGVMMGTVAYCSPEQISQGRADARSDVYAAGIVLYELLTGAAPFRGESAMAVAYQHVNSRVPSPSDPAGPGRGVVIPQALDTLVQRATSREPTGRPVDAGAFLAELHDVRIDLGLPILSVPPRPRPGSAPSPHTMPIAPGQLRPAPGPSRPPATAALPGRSASAPARPHLHQEQPSQQRPLLSPTTGRGPGGPPADLTGPDALRRRKRRRRRRALLAALLVLVLGIAAAVGSWWWVSGRYTSVPDVRNTSMATARTTLTDAGLKVGPTPKTEFSESVVADNVIDTLPAPGGRVLPGKTVVLVVSSGAERFAVPDIARKSQGDATAALKGIPVQVVPSQAADDTVPAGDAIRTDPPAGTQVKRDAVVTLFVSTGPPVIAVPDVTGQDQDDAKDALSAAGFTVAVSQDYSETVSAGDVISQTPAGGASAVKFTAVGIDVSMGPQLITLPQIANGTSTDSATATLQALGLVVSIHKNFGGFLNQVVGMSPAAGAKVRKGSTVTLETV